MVSKLFLRMSFLAVIACILFGGSLLTGCKKDAEFSQKEVDQMKQGPPKEMPAQAREMMEKMKAGNGAPGQPPAGK